MMNLNILIKGRILLTVFCGVILFTSACKYSKQQDELIKSLEQNEVEIPKGLNGKKSFNMADVLFPLGSLFMFGVFAFMGIRHLNSKKAQIGYALGDINEKIGSINANTEMSAKMSDEEKKNLDEVIKFINKGINNS